MSQAPCGWLRLAGMSPDCRELQGNYTDPNNLCHVLSKNGIVVGRTGQMSASYAFGLDPSLLREDERNLKDRTLSISFDGKVLALSYILEGKTVLSKVVADTLWSCNAEGLKLTTINNPNARFDKIPGRVARLRTTTLYRVGNQLVVKVADTSHGRLLYVWPSHHSAISWLNFEAVP